MTYIKNAPVAKKKAAEKMLNEAMRDPAKLQAMLAAGGAAIDGAASGDSPDTDGGPSAAEEAQS